MQPVLPLPILFSLLAAAAATGTALAWRATRGRPLVVRGLVTALRAAALLILATFLLNPGRWEALRSHEAPVWAFLVDRSASMSVEDQEGTRFRAAMDLAEEARRLAAQRGIPVEFHAFDSGLGEERDLSQWRPDGEGSDLVGAGESLQVRFDAAGRALAGVIAVTDGRQTARHRENMAALRARAAGIRFSGVLVGGDHEAADIRLRAARPSITTFAGQPVSVAAVVESSGLGPVRVPVALLDESGATLAEATVECDGSGRTPVTLGAEAPEQSAAWRLTTPVQQGEAREENNEAPVHIRVVTTKTRVFLAEGAPYWDSKFLAQLLRNQESIEVHSVYRLSDQRFFRIDSESGRPAETSGSIFPESAEEMATYDLFVLGKNVDPFLTPEQEAALVAYVRDGGGGVLFSRGKAYTSAESGLEILEPVAWATGESSEFRFSPSADGAATGLFGQALPDPEAAVWTSLPLLKDARRIDSVKPFTRVLAEGLPSGSGEAGSRFPLVLVRRYGQGVTGLVNADGLWKWDFYPDARELGNMYLEFWTQLIQWMSSYSEFLPGQDYSLKLSTVSVLPGEAVGMRLSYRGPEENPAPRLQIVSDSLEESMELIPGEAPPENGRRSWRAAFRPPQPGVYTISVGDDRSDAPAVPETVLTVRDPPAEHDELDADPEFLRRFTGESGGRAVPLAEGEALLEELLVRRAPDGRDTGVRWRPWWSRWEAGVFLAAILGLEWWIRRRNGLI